MSPRLPVLALFRDSQGEIPHAHSVCIYLLGKEGLHAVVCWISIYRLSRANSVCLFPTPQSEILYWQLEMGHDGSIYTTEIGQCYKSGLFIQRVSLWAYPFMGIPIDHKSTYTYRKMSDWCSHHKVILEGFSSSNLTFPGEINSLLEIGQATTINYLINLNVQVIDCANPIIKVNKISLDSNYLSPQQLRDRKVTDAIPNIICPSQQLELLCFMEVY